MAAIKFEVLEFDSTATTQTSTDPTTVYIANHSLNNGDVFVNVDLSTRLENPVGTIESRRVENATTNTFDMANGIIVDQAAGQSAYLFKWDDKTDILKQQSVRMSLNADQGNDTMEFTYEAQYAGGAITPQLNLGQMCKISFDSDIYMLGIIWNINKNRYIAPNMECHCTIYSLKKAIDNLVYISGNIPYWLNIYDAVYYLIKDPYYLFLLNVGIIESYAFLNEDIDIDCNGTLQLLEKIMKKNDLNLRVEDDFTINAYYDDYAIDWAPYTVSFLSTAFTDYMEVDVDENFDDYNNAVVYSGGDHDGVKIFGQQMNYTNISDMLAITGYDPKKTKVANDMNNNFTPIESDDGSYTGVTPGAKSGTGPGIVIDNIGLSWLLWYDDTEFYAGDGTTETVVVHDFSDEQGTRRRLEPGDAIYNEDQDSFTYVESLAFDSVTTTIYAVTPAVSGQTVSDVMYTLDRLMEVGDMVYNETQDAYTWVTSMTIGTAALTNGSWDAAFTVTYEVTPVVSGQTTGDIFWYNRRLNKSLIKELSSRSNYPPQTVRFSSMTMGFKPNQKLTVNLPEMGGVTCVCAIMNVEIQDRGAGEYYNTITAEKKDTDVYNPKTAKTNIFKEVL